uniref:Splicing factor 3b subunit 2-like n=1 Tax=Tetraselmis sp. GSL018 TaxID=582737 RepID=A0A061RQR5_9CHLO
MRQAYQEKEDQKKLKQKQRDRMQPKMGKMDIDYQVLHDAFFKNQTRPKLTGMGDLYYEGKEFEIQTKHCQPGHLSSELKAALGMSEDGPPPWLINMQRYGPPPSYPALRVPGLNAPIPEGASFGYHPGGWGKPPVDEYGNPIYGDVFGVMAKPPSASDYVDKDKHWGDLESEEEESEDEESEEEEEEQEGEDTEALADGYRSVDTDISSLPHGMETPDTIQLRKGFESVESEQQRPLYTVLEQKAASVGGALMGSDHTYVMPDSTNKERRPLNPSDKKRLEALRSQVAGTTDVEVTLTPEEIEGLDDDAIKRLYAQKVQEIRAANKPEDFSDLVAAKAAQQKRKALAKESEKAAKKQKDSFKF